MIGARRMRETRRVEATLRAEETSAELAFVVSGGGGGSGGWRTGLLEDFRRGKKMAEHF